MTIQIPDDLAHALEQAAAAKHKTAEELALENLRDLYAPPGSPAAVLRALRNLPRASDADVDELEASIASGRVPANARGIFDE